MMASWHERDCRRPDVVLMDNTPTCLSCGSIFLENDDETQEQLNKQTALVDKASSQLNLDWPSSITFSSPDDVTDPDLRRTLLNLDRYAEVADLDTASEMTPSEFEAFMEEHTATVPSQYLAEPLKGDAPEDHSETQTSTQGSNPDITATKAEPKSKIQDSVYHSLMGTDEIRLLHLDPYDSVSQPLHGSLKPTRLSQRPDYIALSYTWADTSGDRTLREKIFLGNGWMPFAITSNCASALRRLRSRGGTRVVWVDAICIDQTNIGERSHQVSMMRDIYSRAESVAIFLGGDTGQAVDTPAGRMMQRLSDERFRAGKAVTDNWGGGFDYHGISDLFGQPYWSRIWVIQEVLLARKADIILGNTSISLHEFIENFMKQLPESVQPLLPQWIYSLGGSRFGDVDAFSNLLDNTSTCKSSDERDMIFALFGLVQGASLEGLVADYSKTMAEVYTGLTAYFLIRHGESGLLKAAASAATSTAAAAEFRIQESNTQKGHVHRYPWHPELPSWIPFAKSPDPHETELFKDRSLPDLDGWQLMLSAAHKKQGPNEYYHFTEVQPRTNEPLQTSLSTYKVFGNHGTLLVRAVPVVHISYMGTALSNGAFHGRIDKMFGGKVGFLTARNTSRPWFICVYTDALVGGDDDWIIEVPGCDTFLHLKPSGRVPGTYKIASLSSVRLVRNCHTIETSESSDQDEQMVIEDRSSPASQFVSLSQDTLSPADNTAGDYRFWMPLLSFELHHLFFLRRWDSMTQLDILVAPRQPGPNGSPAKLSPEVLTGYGQWLGLKPTTNSEDGLYRDDFDSAVRDVSLYLERWQDPDVWSRIHQIVIEVPWQANLQKLADIKADAWQYLSMRDKSKDGHGKISDPIPWESRLQGLFDDLAGWLPDIPLRATEGVQSLGSFVSTDTYLSLRNSVKNIPDSWTLEKVRSKEAKIFKDWTEVETCWRFMQRSTADCRALRAKFVQLRALKRLLRREHREFLIC